MFLRVALPLALSLWLCGLSHSQAEEHTQDKLEQVMAAIKSKKPSLAPLWGDGAAVRGL